MAEWGSFCVRVFQKKSFFGFLGLNELMTDLETAVPAAGNRVNEGDEILR